MYARKMKQVTERKTRDGVIGEILRRLVADQTGLAAAVDRGLNEQLSELNVDLGDGSHAGGRDSVLGRVSRKLNLTGDAYVQQTLDLCRDEDQAHRCKVG